MPGYLQTLIERLYTPEAHIREIFNSEARLDPFLNTLGKKFKVNDQIYFAGMEISTNYAKKYAEYTMEGKLGSELFRKQGVRKHFFSQFLTWD